MTASLPATPDPRENERLRDHASRLLTENASLAAELAGCQEALDRETHALHVRLEQYAAELAATRQALEQAVILEYDPSKTDEQNAELHRRAVAVRAVLAGEDTT